MITILVVGFSIGFLHFIGTFPKFLTSPTLDIKFSIMVDIAILVLFPIFIKILLGMDFPRRLPSDRRYTRLMTESEWINFLVQKQNQIQGSFYGSRQATYATMVLLISFLTMGVAFATLLSILIEEPEPIARLAVGIFFVITIFIIAFAVFSGYHLVEEYSYRDKVKEIEKLINDIIDDRIDNTTEIRTRYKEIML